MASMVDNKAMTDTRKSLAMYMLMLRAMAFSENAQTAHSPCDTLLSVLYKRSSNIFKTGKDLRKKRRSSRILTSGMAMNACWLDLTFGKAATRPRSIFSASFCFAWLPKSLLKNSRRELYFLGMFFLTASITVFETGTPLVLKKTKSCREGTKSFTTPDIPSPIALILSVVLSL